MRKDWKNFYILINYKKLLQFLMQKFFKILQLIRENLYNLKISILNNFFAKEENMMIEKIFLFCNVSLIIVINY